MAGPHEFADRALALLVRATAPPGSPVRQRGEREPADPPPGRRLLALASQHDVVLQAAAVSRADPRWANFAAPLAGEARALSIRALALAAELARLIRRFADAGIPVVALKGPVLSQEIFGRPAMRDPGDIDLLVRPEDLFPADRLLEGAGYRREARWAADFAAGDLKRPIARVFHVAYWNAESDIAVEIHWRWFHIEEVARFDSARVWDCLRTIPVGGVPIPVLSQPVQLVYLALHAAKHACERLKWVNDLAWLMRDAADADWAAALGLADRLDMLDLFLAPLLTAQRLGAAMLPPVVVALPPRRAAARLADVFLARLEHPMPRAAIGTLRQKLDWQRTYWRLATHRRDPVRLRLLFRLARNFLARPR